MLAAALVATASLLSAPPAGHAGLYASVIVDDGGVKITTTDGRTIDAPQVPDQVGAHSAAVSADRRSVAWLALYEFCCTSYPLPQAVVVLRDGAVHVFAEGPVISGWDFQSGGTRLAIQAEMPHGGQGVHYSLWDIATERQLADYEPPTDEYGDPLPDKKHEPRWVTALIRSPRKPR